MSHGKKCHKKNKIVRDKNMVGEMLRGVTFEKMSLKERHQWNGGESYGEMSGKEVFGYREKYPIFLFYPTSFFFVILIHMRQQLFIYTCTCMFLYTKHSLYLLTLLLKSLTQFSISKEQMNKSKGPEVGVFLLCLGN